MIAQPKKDSVLITSQFLFPQFTDGKVMMKDGSAYNVKLNYDASLDQMQFMDVNSQILFIGEPDKVNKLEIGKRSFIYRKGYFVEVLIDGPISLFSRVHIQKDVQKNGAYGSSTATSSIQSLSTMKLSDGNDTKLRPSEKAIYQKEVFFFVMVNEKSKLILNEKDLLKCFSSNKELLKKEIDKEQTNFKSADSMKKIVEWIIANGIKN